MSAEKFIQEQWNKIWNSPAVQDLLPHQPNMRYYQKKGDPYIFGWTTQPCGKKKRFYACVYRLVKKGKVWKLKKRVEFARRNRAKARALKWYIKRLEVLKC